MYRGVRPLLFSLDPEFSHNLTLGSLSATSGLGLLKCLAGKPVIDEVEKMGLKFRNRVGLAAGLDKNAECIAAWQDLGFGFIEVGTVTPLPQAGNPKPRLFRLPDHQAIINRMGFNNSGVAVLNKNVERARSKGLQVPLGINIGKNKLTPAEQAIDDYLACLEAVYSAADYVTVNLSSPNTPGLRDLQFGNALDELLQALSEKRAALADQHAKKVPVLVKIAPDMASDDLYSVADRLHKHGIDGVIATNTTIDRSKVSESLLADEQGGLSGKVLLEASTRVVDLLAKHLQGAMTIVGVGGICCADDAKAKIDAGADLVQLYSGLIYAGPGLVKETASALRTYSNRS